MISLDYRGLLTEINYYLYNLHSFYDLWNLSDLGCFYGLFAIYDPGKFQDLCSLMTYKVSISWVACKIYEESLWPA